MKLDTQIEGSESLTIASFSNSAKGKKIGTKPQLTQSYKQRNYSYQSPDISNNYVTTTKSEQKNNIKYALSPPINTCTSCS